MRWIGLVGILWAVSASAEIPPPPGQDEIPTEDFKKELTFSLRSKPKAALPLPVIKKQVKPQKISVWEPHEKATITFEAVNFNRILDKILGTGWRNEEEIVFTCKDGYQPSIPVARFLKHKAYLAVTREGQKKFEVLNHLKDGKPISLGPFYLIWKAPKTAMGATAWPYQITGLDVIRFSDRYPQMSPGRATGDIALGFKAFRTHCLSCHTINGDGGTKGVELNYPVNVTEYYRTNFLKKWILDPPSVRWGTDMPPLPKALTNRSKVADQIVAYLKRMKSHKKKPR